VTEHPGFLADIRANPDDDTPRLVYADWLEDNGDPDRATFIRVQCELARSPWQVGRVYDDPAWLRLHAREQDLLSAHALAWFCALAWPGWYGVAGVAVPGGARWHGGWTGERHHGLVTANFARGFVAHASLLCRRWLELGPRLVRQMPLARVDFQDRCPDAQGPAHLGLFFWVTRRDWWASENGLPPGLRPHLRSGVVHDLGPAPAHDVLGHYYPSESAARGDLSRAALALAGARVVPGRGPAW
jgi:uncharacterized protein (TIGR02996 family)